MCRRRQNITATIYNKRGQVLSIGKNSYIKTHPFQAHHAKLVGQEHKIFLHAEIDAIIKCRHLEKAYRIVVTRVSALGKFKNAKPCEICKSAIMSTRIRHIEHT